MLFNKPLSSHLEAVVFSFHDLSIPLLVQRDDQLHPLLSGNKYRKLQAFAKEDAAGYVSFGGAWSNHLLAVAALARMQGVPSIGYIRGNEPRPTNLYEVWLKQLGMEIRHLSRAHYAHKAAMYAEAQAAHPTFQCIPEGGHPQPNGKAFDLWLQEIPEHTDHVLLSCGTGATLLGLAAAMQRAKRKTKLWGISAINSPKFIENLLAEVSALYPQAKVEQSLAGQRFGKNSSHELALAKAFFEQTGIAPDPVYDSRVLGVLVEQFKNGKLSAADRILWLHSGGITGWAGYPSECHNLFGL